MRCRFLCLGLALGCLSCGSSKSTVQSDSTNSEVKLVSDTLARNESSVANPEGEAVPVVVPKGEVSSFSVGSVSFQMVKVKGGSFVMGATPEQSGEATTEEKPAHKVSLPDYWIGETEVTQALWTVVMGSCPSQIKMKGDSLPVACVSWKDCQQFISKLNALTGKTFRLPTGRSGSSLPVGVWRAKATSTAVAIRSPRWPVVMSMPLICIIMWQVIARTSWAFMI